MNGATPTRLPVLHVHSSFDEGGKELRCVRLINAFGPGATHAIVSARPGVMGAARLISPTIPVVYPTRFPALEGLPAPSRLRRIAQAMKGYGLVLTYNWGAMDAVMAHTLFAGAMGLPPLIHHEDGFNEDEAERLMWRRNWYRRLALGRAAALVVPSRGLERIALDIWYQPRSRVHRIGNGIDVAAFAGRPRRDALPRLIKHEGELWVGTAASLRTVKNLPRLVRAFSALPPPWQLVILGEGSERGRIEAEAVRLGIEHRVHLPGFVARPAQVIGLFDVFALSSDSEQFPLCVAEAMAAGLPVAAPAVGDIATMVARENAAFIAPPGDEGALADALLRLANDPTGRRAIGAANRRKAHECFDEERMIAQYRRLYAAVLGRTSFP